MSENRPKNVPKTAFPKGKSGNAGGRPKGYSSFRASFRGKVTDDVKEALVALIRDPSHKDHFNACRLCLEYGWGKTPAAPEDLAAVRDAGRPLAGATEEAILEALRKGTP